MTPEENKEFVRRHFEEFVNHKDLSAADRNLAPDFYDHDGPGGQPTDREGDKRMMAGMHSLLPRHPRHRGGHDRRGGQGHVP